MQIGIPNTLKKLPFVPTKKPKRNPKVGTSTKGTKIANNMDPDGDGICCPGEIMNEFSNDPTDGNRTRYESSREKYCKHKVTTVE